MAKSNSTSRYFRGEVYARMAEDLHLGGMSERTHAGYLRAVRQLADYGKTPPEKITENQLRRYFLFLKNEKKFAYGSLRVAFSGIKFFYTRTCKRNWQTLAQMKLLNVTTLPEVLTIRQVHQIVDAATTQRMAVYFWTVYSLGLRMQEGLNLQVGDVDSGRMMAHVHRGKGAKDRYVPLPTSTLHQLRAYWVTHRNKRLLFPAEVSARKTIEKLFRRK
jgi:integrase/recombinase XerD